MSSVLAVINERGVPGSCVRIRVLDSSSNRVEYERTLELVQGTHAPRSQRNLPIQRQIRAESDYWKRHVAGPAYRKPDENRVAPGSSALRHFARFEHPSQLFRRREWSRLAREPSRA